MSTAPVARMWDGDGEEFLLHVEIANDNSPHMPLRMLRYYADIRFAKHRGPIRQFLIYIGSNRLTMPAAFDEPGLLDYRYGLVDMHRVDCAGLLVQDNPDALVLAVLCDFGDRDVGEVVTSLCAVYGRCSAPTSGVSAITWACWRSCRENRELKAQVEEAEQMLTEIDVERMPSFAIGFERGEAKGEVRGEAQIVRRLLRRLDMAKVSELLGLSPEEVERILASGGDID